MASEREAYRQLLHGRIAPLGRLVEAELNAKLEYQVTLNLERSRVADVTSKARAYASLVNAGMDATEAAQISVLE